MLPLRHSGIGSPVGGLFEPLDTVAMLRITEVEPTDEAVVLLLEGALRGEWLNELVRVASSHHAAGRSVGLDLSGVLAVDAEATEYLRTGADVEFAIARASGLLARLIDPRSDSNG